MSDTIEDLYPLTPLQKGLLFHALGEPAGGLYVNQLVGELRGRLDVEAFAGAWREALRLNPVLRTAFEWEGVDEPLQVVLREVDLPLAVEDWRDVPAAELDARLERLLADERRRGFALDQAPLLRLWLLRTGEDAHHFVFSHHHLLLDGWSLPNLLRQIFASYDGLRRGSPLLLEPPRLFRDYVAWLGARGLAEAEAHFRRALAGAELPTPLGILSPRTVAGDVGHGEAQTALTVEATRALGEAAKRHRVTPNTLVQAAWALALGAWAGRRDVTYGTTLAGRPPE
ncbi:MAG TPA: condensation domain-containing protein, partial [Polyangiaceae bacterium]|nr:condensation domain-containing protein [Polyangiaceae bacterium]